MCDLTESPLYRVGRRQEALSHVSTVSDVAGAELAPTWRLPPRVPWGAAHVWGRLREQRPRALCSDLQPEIPGRPGAQLGFRATRVVILTPFSFVQLL